MQEGSYGKILGLRLTQSQEKRLPNLESFLVLSPSESPMETIAGPDPKVVGGVWPVQLARGVSHLPAELARNIFCFCFLEILGGVT